MSNVVEFSVGLFDKCKVDLEDLDRITRILAPRSFWHIEGDDSHKRVCATIIVDGKPMVHAKLHRILMGVLHEPSISVDHIDGDPLNNSKSNLRLCGQAQNSRNRPATAYSSTGYKGVFKVRGRYRAIICKNYKNIHLGYFTSAEEAALAYNKAAVEHHGEFAWLSTVQ